MREIWNDGPGFENLLTCEEAPAIAKRHICNVGGGTTTTQSSQNSNVDMGPWKTQAPFLDRMFQRAEGLFENQGGAMKYFPDSTVSPFTPAQTQGYNDIIKMGQQGSPFMPASMQNATDTLSGKYLDPSTNPWLGKTFDAAADAVGRQFKTITAPTTDSLFAGNGAFNGSARYNAQNNNGLGLGTTLNNLATEIYGGNYQNERGRQMQMQGMVPSLINARYLDPTAAINAGGAIQGQNQKELSDEVARWNFNQTSPWQTMAMYKDIIGGNYGQSGTTTTYGTQTVPNNSSPFGQALGGIMGLAGTAGQLWGPFGPFGAAAGAGAGASGSLTAGFMASPEMIPAAMGFLSDARAKEDISEPIGETKTGVPIRMWRYKGDPEMRVGVIAQEVEQTHPDAVVEHPSGLKVVNYARMLGPSVFMPRAA